MTTKKYKDKGSPQRVVRILNHFGSGVRYGVHNDSLVNLERGICERILYTPTKTGLLEPVCQPNPGAFTQLHHIQNRILSKTRSTTPVNRESFPLLYRGRRRLIYERAVESLRADPIQQRDAMVSAFVKAEKINFSDKPDPAPRIIQPRHPRYNVEIGRYLKPFEHNAYEGFAAYAGYPVILKGLNASQQAVVFHDSWSQFVKPVAIGLDASRFDQHVSQDALRFEHRFYNLKFQSKELATLLNWQLHTKGIGRARDGHVKYSVNGSRMSGDMNTALGNCIIMATIVLWYLESNHIHARLHNNGDDCTVILEHRDLQLMDGIDDCFTHFGFRLTREPVVYEFERIEFCQTRPVLTSTGWRMVRNPYTAISKDCVSLLSWSNEVEFQRWRNAAECGITLTKGVPVWERWYQTLWAPQTAEYAVDSICETGMGFLSRGIVGGEITQDSRYSFYLAFGILPDDQVALEESIPGVCWLQPEPMSDIADITPFTRYFEQRNDQTKAEAKR